MYEQPFRLAAVHAGLELRHGTSPPVLQRSPGTAIHATSDAATVTRAIDALRRLPDTASEDACDADPLLERLVHLLGPVGISDLTSFLSASARDLRTRWRALHDSGHLVEVTVDGSPASLLAEDVPDAADGSGPAVVRLLGPFDLFLQARDRRLLVPDTSRHTALWPTLGRPGAVLDDGEIAGVWRPRASGKNFKLFVEPWTSWDASLQGAVDDQGELLARHRGAEYAGRAAS